MKALVATALAVGFIHSAARAEVLTIPQTSYKRCIKENLHGSCYELGNLYQNTSKPGDIALGDQYVRFGCKLDLKRKCTQGEANARSASYLKAKKDWDAVKQKALNDMPSVKSPDETKCENGDAKACGDAGTHFFYLGKPTNPAKGKALFEEGCRLGDKHSCSSVELIKKGIVKVYDVEM